MISTILLLNEVWSIFSIHGELSSKLGNLDW